MTVSNGPVGVMRQRINTLDRHERTFERRHAIRRHRDNHELQHGLLTQLIPRAAQGEQTVQHTAPTRRDEHQ